MSENKLFRLSVIFNIIGVGLASYLLWHGVKINSVGLDGSSICSINSYFDCDSVALSKYSSIFGIPIAAFLLAYYLCSLIFLSLNTLFKNNKIFKVLFYLSTLFLIPTVYQLVVSLFIIKQVCLFCLGSYVVNIILFLLACKLKSGVKESTVNILKNEKPAIVFCIIAVAFSLFMPKLLRDSFYQGKKPDIDLIVKQHFFNPVKEINLKDQIYFGKNPEQAKIVIVEFSDAQCPYCAQFSQQAKGLFKAFKNDISFVSMHYPIDQKCNPNMKSPGHIHACATVKAAHCVSEELGSKAYFDFKSTFYKNQKSITEHMLLKWAKNLGVNEAKFKSCLNSDKTQNYIKHNLREAKKVGIDSTPTIFVNGRRLRPPLIPALKQIILKSL